MKDGRFFNINPHYTETRVIRHTYVRLPSPEIFSIFFVIVFPTFKRFMIQKPHVTQLTGVTQLAGQENKKNLF